eukprot:jgi/Ulvmu1/11947/UM082_0026.1
MAAFPTKRNCARGRMRVCKLWILSGLIGMALSQEQAVNGMDMHLDSHLQALPGRQLQQAIDEPVNISSPRLLEKAILTGYHHIVITAHMDLTTLPLRHTSICDSCVGPLPEMITTMSIRGNCAAPPTAGDATVLAATPGAAQLLPFRPGQCLMLTHDDLLPLFSHRVWVDNLYLRAVGINMLADNREDVNIVLAAVPPLPWPLRGLARRYFTRTTFQGDGLGPTVAFWADENVYAENCTFANLGGNGFGDCPDCTGGLNAANASVAVVGSTFFDPAPFRGTSYFRAFDGGRISTSGCEFAPTPHLQLSPFYARDNSTVYSDDAAMRVRSDSGPPVAASPLAAIPDYPPGSNKIFLQRSDPWFVAIRQTLNATLAPQPAYPAPATAVPRVPRTANDDAPRFDNNSRPLQAVDLPPPVARRDDSMRDATLIAIIVALAVLLALSAAVCAVSACFYRADRRAKQNAAFPGMQSVPSMPSVPSADSASSPGGKPVDSHSTHDTPSSVFTDMPHAQTWLPGPPTHSMLHRGGLQPGARGLSQPQPSAGLVSAGHSYSQSASEDSRAVDHAVLMSKGPSMGASMGMSKGPSMGASMGMSKGPSMLASEGSFTARLRDGISLHGSREATSVAGAEPPLIAAPPLTAPRAEQLAALHAQLDSISADTVLLNRFQLLTGVERAEGGSAVVAFASCMYDKNEYAIKVFAQRERFEAEAALRSRITLHAILPRAPLVHDPLDAASSRVDLGGRVMAPCIVMPRGESLTQWSRRAKPDVFLAATVLSQVTTQLRNLHAACFVHREVKPAHIMLLPRENRWTLIDFSCAAATGAAVAPPTMRQYAAPETVAAGEATTIAADPAHDAWGLGMVAFELLTGEPALSVDPADTALVKEQLAGTAPLPWEAGRITAEARRRLGVFRKPVLALLQRDPAQRASVQHLCDACYAIVSSHTTSG